MVCRRTAKADEDLIGIYLYGVETFGTAQAEAYFSGLEQCFELLAAQPLIARERPEFRPPVRFHFHRAHVVVYLIDGESVLIVRVLHGRQDWERHLRDVD
ncbi:MAG: type II toxin-antitoxin system RelE/ParE family toxin [Parvibaculum sp.]|uniref:type II toxin-antitoxin system RelE/ParE family toxin n=1 Tax=Parvibaculum sp. TaxID=2024848 RepID=UPI0027282706|nr:type II toxin-antitoxin system RelE/ParE family toxin [Parvibaculum sp.]MDO8837434.1 type II toxin-antitoxin system RelE/ParE family toxin [Parvibaculum sp.]